ncbi:MAG: HAD hydrolase family protein [Burkholderiales bacterium]|nr:HAD hydrolase family protein [Burkholderiales bacterium]
MNLRILALDFDGTIAVGDAIDPEAAEAIREARSAGLMAILVTGRTLADLDRRLPDAALFDAVVAENGAVLRFFPNTSPVLLCGAPDAQLVGDLTRKGISHSSGSCIVDAPVDAAPQILDSIHRLGLPLAIAFNRGRLMVVPLGVTKGSGLNEALWRLRASPHNAVAIGDAENDHALLALCELGAAVAWGSDALRRAADEVIPGSDPSAVARFIRGLLPARRIPLGRGRRRWIRLGHRDDGAPVDLALHGRNLVIGGDPKSGKSWLAGLLCEQLIHQRYSVCILDPEGDYACLEALPGVIVQRVERIDGPFAGVERILAHPDLSLVVDMSAVAQCDKRTIVRRVLQLVNRARQQTGLPHRVLIDEAHYFLGRLDDPELFDRDLGGYVLVSYRVADLSADVLAATDAVIVTKVADRRQALALRELAAPVGTTADWLHALASLAIDEALILPRIQEAPDRLMRFRIAPRMTVHVRHRQKYCDVPVRPGSEFVFTRRGVPTGQRAHTLASLASFLPDLPDEVLRGHLARGDFHRWAERVFGDFDLGDAFRRAEGLEPAQAGAAMVRAILDRYGKTA